MFCEECGEMMNVWAHSTIQGYIYRCPNCGSQSTWGERRLEKRREARLIMQEKLGRQMNSAEHVHFIDGDVFNTDLENLYFCKVREHRLIHSQRRIILRKFLELGLTDIEVNGTNINYYYVNIYHRKFRLNLKDVFYEQSI